MRGTEQGVWLLAGAFCCPFYHKNVRKGVFLRDVFQLACSAIGGSEAHLPFFLRLLVGRRAYLSKEQLLEKQALCQMLPGPTSTQLLVLIAYQRGGLGLAAATFGVWILPATTCMIGFAISVEHVSGSVLAYFGTWLRPLVVALIAHAATVLCRHVVHTPRAYALVVASACAAVFWVVPYAFPVILVVGGGFAALSYDRAAPTQKVLPMPYKLLLVFSLLCGGIFTILYTMDLAMWRGLFQNGLFVLGGGSALISFLYTDFVQQGYVAIEEFVAGVAFSQVTPGTIFALTAYLGALSLPGASWGTQVLGGVGAVLVTCLPGVSLAILLYRFWYAIAQHKILRAAIKGIHAVVVGLIFSAAFKMLTVVSLDLRSYALMAGFFVAMHWGRVPPVWLLVVCVGIAALTMP